MSAQHKFHIAGHRRNEVIDTLQLDTVLTRPTDRGLFITLATQNATGSARHKLDPAYTPVFSSQTSNMRPTFAKTNKVLGIFHMLDAVPGKHARGVKLVNPITSEVLQSSPQVDVYTGKARRQPKHAGSSRDSTGSKSKWSPAIPSQVPVDVDALIGAIDAGELTDTEDAAARYIVEGSPDGMLTQTYTESRAGRQYADSISTQNVPKKIRRIALDGYEVDMVNAHVQLTVTQGLAGGFIPLVLQHYMANTGEVRQQVATELCIPVDGAKEVLIAALYGSRPTHQLSEIVTRHGGDPRLMQECTTLKWIITDAARARYAMLNNATYNTRGELVNALGKTIPGSYSALQKVAHILQGLEALILRAATEGEVGVVSLEHDGWTTHSEPDLRGAEKRVKDGTGMDVKFATKYRH